MQQLIFEGHLLEDKKLVFDYNIQRGSSVDLQIPAHTHTPLPYWIAGSINISVKCSTGHISQIRAKGTDTIDNVKSRIQNVCGIPGERSKPGSKRSFWQIYFDSDRPTTTDFRWTGTEG